MFLYGPSAATDLDGAVKNVRGIVEKHGGEILVLKKWDERKLAYEINKQKRGPTSFAISRVPARR